MKKVLFVCTGNTCRSPMAEFLFRDILQKRGIQGVEVFSAGLHIYEGDTINPHAKSVLAKHGIDADGFESTQITMDMLDHHDFVVCMTFAHKDALPQRDNIFTLGELVDMPDVSDPFGKDEPVYALCFQQLKGELQKLADIFEEQNDK